MALPPDFKELLAAFDLHGVEYLIVGGYAVAFHARPRFTKDLDIWIGAMPSNLTNARRALEEFGAPESMLRHLESASPEDVLWMGIPPVRVDVVKGVPGGDFARCYANRVMASWEGIPVTLVSKTDLIVIKKASGRPQDLLDVDALEDG